MPGGAAVADDDPSRHVVAVMHVAAVRVASLIWRMTVLLRRVDVCAEKTRRKSRIIRRSLSWLARLGVTECRSRSQAEQPR